MPIAGCCGPLYTCSKIRRLDRKLCILRGCGGGEGGLAADIWYILTNYTAGPLQICIAWVSYGGGINTLRLCTVHDWRKLLWYTCGINLKEIEITRRACRLNIIILIGINCEHLINIRQNTGAFNSNKFFYAVDACKKTLAQPYGHNPVQNFSNSDEGTEYIIDSCTCTDQDPHRFGWLSCTQIRIQEEWN